MGSSKIEKELGWKRTVNFEEGIIKTIKWYLDNQAWINNIENGSYKDFYKEV